MRAFQKEKQGQLSFAAKQSGRMQKEVKKKKITDYSKGIFMLSVTNTSRNVHPAYETHSLSTYP